MAARDEIVLVIRQIVLEETRRSLSSYSLVSVFFFDRIIEAIPFEYVRPTKREVIVAAKHIVFKDAPIIAAAKKAKVDFLVTLDKKHLLGKPELVAFTNIPIVTLKKLGLLELVQWKPMVEIASQRAFAISSQEFLSE